MKTFKEFKNHLFIKAYLDAKGNLSEAARSLDVPKSTYIDWAKINRELLQDAIN